jgi:hypothetical protein
MVSAPEPENKKASEVIRGQEFGDESVAFCGVE